jgi:hypothetical protein
VQLGRAVEFPLLFVGLPILFDQMIRHGHRRLLFPGLWLFATLVGWSLARDPSFVRQHVTALPWNHPLVSLIGVRTAMGIGLLALLARRVAPDDFLRLPRERPGLFAIISVLYPLLSVVPQGLIWRVFFVHRYLPLFGAGFWTWSAAALAFAFAHIIFRNGVAVVLTGIGGALFAHSYMATGSMLFADLEHAIYGVAVFAFGLGKFLYLGLARARTET